MGVIRCLIVKQLWAGSEFRNKATPAVDNRPSLLQFLFLAIRWIIDRWVSHTHLAFPGGTT
jgi:hypothetical protein